MSDAIPRPLRHFSERAVAAALMTMARAPATPGPGALNRASPVLITEPNAQRTGDRSLRTRGHGRSAAGRPSRLADFALGASCEMRWSPTGVRRLRWQHPDQPAPAELILGPQRRPPELFSRLFSRDRWWEPVPRRADPTPRAELAAISPGH